MHNGLKTAVLLGALSGLLILGGSAIAGRQGLFFGLVFAIAMNFVSYFFSAKIALAMSGARPLTPEEFPDIYNRVRRIVEPLAQRMGIPMPELYITPEPSPNAFATGRDPNHSAIAFTEGILQVMDDGELEGVVAHELGHVLHRDILISSIAGTMAAAITSVARMAMWFGMGGDRDDDDRGNGFAAIAMMLLAPLAAALIQMAISRSREYEADEASAKYTHNPQLLISALGKLDIWAQQIPMEATPATQHLYIMKPLGGGSMMRLFSTHPSTEDRIRRLQALR